MMNPMAMPPRRAAAKATARMRVGSIFLATSEVWHDEDREARTSITGLKVELRKIIETKWLAGIVTARARKSSLRQTA